MTQIDNWEEYKKWFIVELDYKVRQQANNEEPIFWEFAQENFDKIISLLTTQEEEIVGKFKEAIQKDIDFAAENNQMYSAEAYKVILIMESNKN